MEVESDPHEVEMNHVTKSPFSSHKLAAGGNTLNGKAQADILRESISCSVVGSTNNIKDPEIGMYAREQEPLLAKPNVKYSDAAEP